MVDFCLAEGPAGVEMALSPASMTLWKNLAEGQHSTACLARKKQKAGVSLCKRLLQFDHESANDSDTTSLKRRTTIP